MEAFQAMNFIALQLLLGDRTKYMGRLTPSFK